MAAFENSELSGHQEEYHVSVYVRQKNPRGHVLESEDGYIVNVNRYTVEYLRQTSHQEDQTSKPKRYRILINPVKHKP